MMGLIPFEGDILIEGKSLKDMKRKEISQKIALMSQNQLINGDYDVETVVSMGRYAHQPKSLFNHLSDQDNELVETVLKQVGLWELRKKSVARLSGGQRQMVFLAKTIVQTPKIILLDEPSNHLDIKYQLELLSFLKIWHNKHKTTMIGVFHDINLAAQFSEDFLMLKKGEIIYSGKISNQTTLEAINELYEIDVIDYYQKSLKRWSNIL